MKNITVLKKVSIPLLAMLVVATPFAAFAKHANVSAGLKVSQDTSCTRAFGHLVAPVWKRVKGKTSVQVGDSCNLPAGIARILAGQKGTGGDSEDEEEDKNILPTVSTVISAANSTQAELAFRSNEPTRAEVFYGTSAGVDVNNSVTLKVTDNSLSRLHSVLITGLTANTKYYAVVRVTDTDGNTALSSEINFTTKAVADTTAPKLSGVVTSSTNSSISVSWNTDESATSKVFYGTLTPLNTSASTTSKVESGTMVTTHSLTVPNLSANTQYYLEVESKDASGNIATSTEFGVKTGI